MLRLILAASVTPPATAVSIAAVTFSEPACRSAARSLAVLAVFLTNSRAASGPSRFLSASVTGANAFLTLSSTGLVSVVMGVSPSSGLSYGLTPSGLARGDLYMTPLMVRRNIDIAMQYHEFVISLIMGRSARETGQSVRRVPCGRLLPPVGHHPGRGRKSLQGPNPLLPPTA